jgi:hypothetical protein
MARRKKKPPLKWDDDKFEERSCIIQYSQGVTRQEADRIATAQMKEELGNRSWEQGEIEGT